MKRLPRWFTPSLSALALGLSACGGTELPESEPLPSVSSHATPLATTVQLRPTSDVAINSVVGVGSTTQLYTNVDDGTAFTAANDADAVRGVDGVEWTSHVVGFSGAPAGAVSEVTVNVRGLPGTGAGTLQVVLLDGDTVLRYAGERTLTTAQNLTETFTALNVANANTLRVKVLLHNTRGTGSLRYSQLWMSAQVNSGPCAGDTRVLWGVRHKSEGTASEKLTAISNFELAVGREFKLDRQYLQWNDAFPNAYHTGTRAAGRRLVLSLNPVDGGTVAVRWPAIARGDNAAINGRIDALADAIKAFGDKVYFAFHHEPEDDLADQGTEQDFVNAWRYIVDRMTARGVVRGTHVEYVWIMMAYSFQNGADRAQGFYPGDAYVDWIGSDGYNWSNCRPTGGTWTTFESVFRGTKDFAQQHGKRVMLAEWGSESQGVPVGTSKDAWFDQASTLLSSDPEWCVVQAMTYYNSDGPTASACEWWVYPSSVGTGFAGFKRMGLQPHFAR